MHEDSEQSIGSCNQLLQATMDALPSETQGLLLRLMIWKRNRRAHTVYVLARWVWIVNGLAVTNQTCVSHRTLRGMAEGAHVKLHK